MIYKEYGSTGKMVSAIGFGGMRFPKTDTGYDLDYCAEMIHEAGKLGINYFDTAPYYCDDKSEDIFGHAFKKMKDDFYISTKCSAWKGSNLRASLEKSLKRLNVNKIDFFHVWCVLNMDDYEKRMAPGGPYQELLKAKEEGLVDHICISTHCTGKEIAEIASQGKYDGILLGYNVINYKYRLAGLEAAYANKTGVVTMNPLGGGLIPENPDYFSYIMDENDNDVIDSAIRYNASHKEISVVLTGMDSIEHVRKNCSNLELSEDYVQKTRLKADKFTLESHDSLCTGCRYCEHCPEDIPVSKFMLAYNKTILKDDATLKSMIKMHWRIPPELADKCIECGLCEKKCTQHLPIIERLKYISDLY
jgi:predicted aldo/keto reductase-like oxidoreductase